MNKVYGDTNKTEKLKPNLNNKVQSCARGLGITTLTMHHGTVFGTSFLFVSPKTVS